MSDLFSSQDKNENHPLAYRMRPRSLDEYIGQDHIVGKGRLLRRAISADLLSSVIFYGPPGSGKTTLARVIANSTKSHFATLNAVLSGVKELRYEIDEAKKRLEYYNRKTILFVDEVHRWNKSQQDALLPWVENGTIILIGATTENPYFEVNAALVSRSRIFQLLKLTDDDLLKVAKMALNDKERGYGRYNIEFEEGALEHLVNIAAGDARSLLNALQLAIETTSLNENEKIYITKADAEESIQQKVVLYDKEGDYHFDVISAFIKSIRGSDPDASLYWLARMVKAGEDPRFIFRRMLISACEDVGLADPNAIRVVEACASAFDRIGLPEGRFHLTQAALYLATCKKSNSTLGFFDALMDVENESNQEVPNHLKDPSRDKNSFNHGDGYLYPHAYKDHWVKQQYLPNSLQGKIYYNPSDQGYEKTIKESVEEKRASQLEMLSLDDHQEILTYSPKNKKDELWLERSSKNGSKLLLEIKDKLLSNAKINRSDNILILNASHGLLVFSAIKHNPEGFTLSQVNNQEQKDYIDHYKKNLDLLRQPEVVIDTPRGCLEKCDINFEHIFGKNLFSKLLEESELAKLLKGKLKQNGHVYLSEMVPSLSSRLSDFIQNDEIASLLKRSEEKIFTKENPMTNWDEEVLKSFFSKYFINVEVERISQMEDRLLDERLLSSYLDSRYIPSYPNLKEYRERIIFELKDKTVEWNNHILIIKMDNINKSEIFTEIHKMSRR